MSATENMSFWKTAAIYGFPAGFGIISFMLISFETTGFHSGASSMAVGFLLMFVILSLIFFGIKKFRDQGQGGVIRFSKALFLGLAMSLCAAISYVLIWEIYLNITDSEFIFQYTEHLIELQKAKVITSEELTAFMEGARKKADLYDSNALYRMAITFSEIFPMGFIVSLISALALHNPKLWARRSN